VKWEDKKRKYLIGEERVSWGRGEEKKNFPQEKEKVGVGKKKKKIETEKEKYRTKREWSDKGKSQKEGVHSGKKKGPT